MVVTEHSMRFQTQDSFASNKGHFLSTSTSFISLGRQTLALMQHLTTFPHQQRSTTCREAARPPSQDHYSDQVVAPLSLHSSVLDILHSSRHFHDGIARLVDSFLAGHYNRHRETETVLFILCQECTIATAPPNASINTTSYTVRASLNADFFDCVGHHYLVVGDRLSGWSDVFQAPKGSPQAGSNSLNSCLRNYFSRFGVPEKLFSDGGPEFVSNSTKDFLSKWGLSSAYNPQSNGRAELLSNQPNVSYDQIQTRRALWIPIAS